MSGLKKVAASAVATVMLAGIVGVLGHVPAASAASLPLIVTSTADASDTAPGDGLCLTSTGLCTLRAALEEANALPGHDVINFAILGAAPHVIAPATDLPWMSDDSGVTIDGYSQPDSSVNTLDAGSNAVITVELKGQGYGYPKPNGLRFDSPGNTVRGLSVWNFNIGFYLHGDYVTHRIHDNHMDGNFIGIDSTGTQGATAYLPGSSGVNMEHGAFSNYVGSPGNANRNVISGNPQHGVATYDGNTTGNVIQNNIVGLAPDGTRAFPNRSHGIDINTGSTDTVIGGPNPGEGNVVSGNIQEGVEISHNPGTLRNHVVGNLIGASVDGLSAPLYARNGEYGVNLEGQATCSTTCPPDAGESTITGNVIVNSGFGGVLIDKGQHDNVVSGNNIGLLADGTPAGNRLFGVRMEKGAFGNDIGPNNVIAYNGEAANQRAGVEIASDGTDPASTPQVRTYSNTITANSIHDNAGLGIDLMPITTPTPVPDPLVNDGVNMPVIGAATVSDISVTTCASCTVELFYADGTKDEYGEGRTFILSKVANEAGVVHFVLGSNAQGKVVTATTTDTLGNTSEFSHNALVAPK